MCNCYTYESKFCDKSTQSHFLKNFLKATFYRANFFWIYKNVGPISYETHYASATNFNLPVLLRETAGRAIAQAVSRWLPTGAARVRTRVWSSGGQSGAGAGFLRVLRFPLPIFIPPNSPSSQSPGAGIISQLVAELPSRPSLDSITYYANLKIILWKQQLFIVRNTRNTQIYSVVRIGSFSKSIQNGGV
jgi:hypothetical protein